MKSFSLRTKITVLAVLIGGMGMVLFAVVMGYVLRKTKMESVDDLLKQQAGSFFAALSERERPMNWAHDPSLQQLFNVVHSLYSIEIEQPLGMIVYRTRNIHAGNLPLVTDDVPLTVLTSGGEARVFQRKMGDVRIRIAADLAPSLETLRTMRTYFAITLPTILLIIALGARWLMRKALKPVEEIATLADKITATRLDQRIPPTKADDEFGQLTIILNRMMDRLERSFEQSRRFASDASHELKTPLTIISGEVEASLRAGDLPPSAVKTMVNIQEETGRLVHIMEGLLLLSQADAGKFTLALQPLNLSEFVSEMQEDVEILAHPKNITLDMTVDPGIWVLGDSRFLRQVMLNLFDNAIKYNIESGRIEAMLERRGSFAYFRIGNSGKAITGKDRLRVFDRFYRAEPSRERARGGQGLGLSICAEIVRAHHGRIILVDDSMSSWTTFEFHIPITSQRT